MNKLTIKTLLFTFCATCIISGTAFSQTIMGDPAKGAALYENCVPCHGLNGKGIAGMSVEKIVGAIHNSQTGTFTKPLQIGMQEVTQTLTEQQILDLASYITKM